jgi:hypothetical protein
MLIVIGIGTSIFIGTWVMIGGYSLYMDPVAHFLVNSLVHYSLALVARRL